jgi:hypothetical protein
MLIPGPGLGKIKLKYKKYPATSAEPTGVARRQNKIQSADFALPNNKNEPVQTATQKSTFEKELLTSFLRSWK